jgi:hypothetical protein
MAGTPAENTVIVDNEVVTPDANHQQGNDASKAEGNEGAAAQANEDNEVIVSFGDPPPGSEPEDGNEADWIKDLRKRQRELTKRNRELEAENASFRQPKTIELGEKPTLESCEYDADKYEQALMNWHGRKQQVEQQQAQLKAEQDAQAQEWQRIQDRYKESKGNWKTQVRDYDDAETEVSNTLNAAQQNVILHGSGDPSKLLYALGKNPAKLKELAKVSNLVQFAFAVAKLEEQLKVTPRKAPPPDKTPRGSATSLAGGTDQTLERLREEADKTGDLSKVVAYKAQMRAKGIRFN